MSKVDKIKTDLEQVVKLITDNFGDGYAVRNPAMVQHLMDKIQQEEDRQLNKDLNQLS